MDDYDDNELHENIWFGKHNGKPWDKLPTDYLQFIAQTFDPDRKPYSLAVKYLKLRGVQPPTPNRTAPSGPNTVSASPRQHLAQLVDRLEARVMALETRLEKLDGQAIATPVDPLIDDIPF